MRTFALIFFLILNSKFAFASFADFEQFYNEASRASLLDLPWYSDTDFVYWNCVVKDQDNAAGLAAPPVFIPNVPTLYYWSEHLNAEEERNFKHVLCDMPLPFVFLENFEGKTQELIDLCRKESMKKSIEDSFVEGKDLKQVVREFMMGDRTVKEIRVKDNKLIIKSSKFDYSFDTKAHKIVDTQTPKNTTYTKCWHASAQTDIYAVDSDLFEDTTVKREPRADFSNIFADTSGKDWYRAKGLDYLTQVNPFKVLGDMRDDKPLTKLQRDYYNKEGIWTPRPTTQARRNHKISRIKVKKRCNRPLGVNPDIKAMKDAGRRIIMEVFGPHTDAVGEECGNGYSNLLRKIKRSDCIGTIMMGGVMKSGKTWNFCTRAKPRKNAKI